VKRLLGLLLWEARLQRRYLFYAVTVVVTIVWIGLFQLLPPAARANPAALVPAFVLTNLQITAFYFAAALVLLERTQGVLPALLVAPVAPHDYLLVKMLSLTLLGAAENAVIVAFVFGVSFQWGWFALGTAALSAVYVFAAIAAVAPHAGINTFLVPSIGWITIFTAPLIGYYDIVPWWVFAWHPLMPGVRLLEAAFRDVPTLFLVYPVVGSVAWTGAALAWAHQRFTTVLVPTSM
jgi:fluoroquinolone transport system permease protein